MASFRLLHVMRFDQLYFTNMAEAVATSKGKEYVPPGTSIWVRRNEGVVIFRDTKYT